MFKAVITGNIGSNAVVAEIREEKFLKMSVAHQERKDAPTVWVEVLWRLNDRNMQIAGKLVKGTRIYAYGPVKVTTYAKEGTVRYNITVWASDVEVQKWSEVKPFELEESNDDDLPDFLQESTK